MLVFWFGQGLLLIRGTCYHSQLVKIVSKNLHIDIILGIIMHIRLSGE